MADEELSGINEVAVRLGISMRTLRFYEDKGLVEPRRVGTTRIYSRRDVARVQLILRGKRLGFSLREIAEFLDLYDADPEHAEQMRRLAERCRERIDELERQQTALEQTLTELREIEGKPARGVAAHGGAIGAATAVAVLRNRAPEEEGMAEYTADVAWALGEGEDFARGRYSRGHSLVFDGGVIVSGSASPHAVGRWAVAEAVDPEELLVAALASCHMLVFLHVAREAGFVILSYRDRAAGSMTDIGGRRQAVGRVMLHPVVEWDGEAPDEARLAALHHAAHEGCFIANSVKTEVIVA